MGKRTRAAAAALAASSLSSFLVAPGSGLDNDIFSNSAGPSIAFAAKKAVKADQKEKKEKKKAASPVPSSPPAAAALNSDDEADVANDAELSEADSDEVLDLPSDSDDDDGVEEAYAAKQAATRLKALAEGGKSKKRKAGDSDEEESDEEEEEEQQSGDESELDIDNLVHESLLPKALYKEVPATPKDLKKAKAARTKAVSTETPAERDVRTLFLGNVPVSCSTSRPSKKALLRHVLNSPALLALLPPTCPPLKADSIRFRSLAFASTVFGRKATTDAPTDEPAAEAGGRGRKRAREWRDSEGTDERGVKGGFHAKEGEKKAQEEAAAAAKGHKGALTDGQKRRVAFIRGELNEGKKACNAYLVLEPFPATYSGLSTLDLLTALVAATDGTVFEGFTLRADHVRPRSAAATMAAAQMASKPSKQDSLAPPNTGASYTVPPIEARRTLFMGGLDFAENEENVRVATEAVLVKERGEAKGEKGWVERVRLIRDASTGLGKGFGYVLLRDAECVDEILALPPGFPLKVSKRKVRLERCKTGVAAARAKASAAAKEVKAAAEAKNPTTAFAPRDPATLLQRAPKLSAANSESAQQARIAQALAKLPVGERKAIKAIDPERLMRRAQKKKNKVLGERYERKKASADKGGILGRETRSAERTRKEKKRVKAGNVTGKRAKKIK